MARTVTGRDAHQPRIANPGFGALALKQVAEATRARANVEDVGTGIAVPVDAVIGSRGLIARQARVTTRRISGARPMKSIPITEATAQTASITCVVRVPGLPALTTVAMTSSEAAPVAVPPTRVAKAFARRRGHRERCRRGAIGRGSLRSSRQSTKLAAR